ncbi:MAG: TonB-dependent receptor [Pirellulales bacterium]|nr:TonB-dependent receptor [Pirellulales bacterium]
MRNSRKIQLFVFSLLIFFNIQLFSQSEDVIITKEYDGFEWNYFIKKIEKKYSVRFFYDPEIISEFTISIKNDAVFLEDVLRENLKPYKITVSIDKLNNIFLVQKNAIQVSLADDFFKSKDEKKEVETKTSEKKDWNNYLKTNREYISRNVVIGTKREGAKMAKVSVSGFLRNISDGKTIIGGNIYVKELEIGTTTNVDGFYSLTLKKGKYTFIISSLGYEEEKFKVDLLSNGVFNIDLITKSFLLDEFTVSSERFHNVRGNQMGLEKLSTKKITEIPVVLGEKDIIKVALLLPGIQTVGEGSSGFNVRGSPADQNLFYINGVPVYNTSHLFGFFSSFNSDAINEFSLYKSNIPVQFGGRLSSVFNISAKQGNQKKFSMMGGISPISGKILVEGPIQNGKSSYLIGLRSTYSDWMLKTVRDLDIQNSSAKFSDAVANFSFALNQNNRLQLFTYFSYDLANIAKVSEHDYTNLGASVSWQHYFNNKHDLDLTFSTSDYSFKDQNMEYDFAAYQQSYQLKHHEAKLNFTLRPNENHKITIGMNSILYLVNRGDYLPLNDLSLVDPKSFEAEKGIESGIYIGDEWKISPLLEISGGLRYNLYSCLGPNTVYQYMDNMPKDVDNIIDTLHFANNEVVKTYTGLDFRFGAKYLINENLSVKAGFNRLHQYIFLLSNTIAISPTDIWKLSDYNINPMVGDQLSLGFYSNLLKNHLEASVEVYYKKVNELVEYKDGAKFFDNEIPETDIVQGNLDSYGIEFMIKKPYGRLNGWVNYTYSNASIVVNNELTGERNNFGLAYPANYDKPHAFNLVGNYKISRRISLSGNVVYSTGRPITYPTSIYYQNGARILNYSMRNEYRLPDYFRIDLSLKIEGNLQKRKLAHGSLIFSIYNLTGRKNAYSIYFNSKNGNIYSYKLSIFGVPIPSITYSFKLGNYED